MTLSRPPARPPVARTKPRGAWLWLATLALLLPWAGAWAAAPERAQRPAGDALSALLESPIGARPADEMHWAQVLDRLGRSTQATRLREWLLARWLQQVSGEALPPPQPLKSVLDAPAAQVVPVWDAAAQQRWRLAFNRQLLARLPTTDVPLPGEIEALAKQLQTLGPGQWLLRDRAGTARTRYAWVELVAQGPQAFPVVGFTVPVGGQEVACALPRGQAPSLLTAGGAQGLLCAWPLHAAAEAEALQTTRLADALLRAGPTSALRPDDLAREGVRLGLADALAQPHQAARDTWLQQRQQATVQQAVSRQARQEATSNAQERRVRVWHRALTAVLVVVGVIGFVLAARRWGPWWAAGALWLAGMAVCVPLAWSVFQSGRGQGGWGAMGLAFLAMALLAAPTVAATALAAWYGFLTRLVGDAGFRRNLGMGLLAMTIALLLQVLLTRLL